MKRTSAQREMYEANREARLFVAGGECEARWHPKCPTLTGRAPRRGPFLLTHHVVMRKHGGTDEADNLRVVCEWCHNRIHSRPADAERRGLLVAKRAGA